MKKPSKKKYLQLCKIHRRVFINWINTMILEMTPGTRVKLLKLYDQEVGVYNISKLYNGKMLPFFEALMDDNLPAIFHKDCFTIKVGNHEIS